MYEKLFCPATFVSSKVQEKISNININLGNMETTLNGETVEVHVVTNETTNTTENTTTETSEATANEAEVTKNLFELWVAAQQKIVANWLESTEKFKEAVRQGDVLQKGSELYKEWFENQRQIVAEFTEKVGTTAKDQLPEFAQNLVRQQQELTAKWMEMVNVAVKEKMTGAEHIFSETKRVYDNLSGNFTENVQKMLPWLNGTIENIKTLKDNANKDAIVNLLANTKAYMAMMEVWQPFYKMVTENRLNAEEFTAAYNLQKYQEVINTMFNVVNPDLSRTYFEQLQNYLNNYKETFRNATNYPVKDAMEFFTKLTPTNFDFASVGQFQQQAMEQLKKIYEPYSKIIAPDKTKEVVELMAKIQEHLVQYQVKVAEMQHLVNSVAQKAMEQTAKELFDMAKDGKSVESYNKFYTHWLGVLEGKMLDLFNSEQFAKLQGELLALSLDIKASLEKNIEMALAPLPVVPRSEIDDLNKQLHDLKAKVKSLEKALEDNQKTTVVTEEVVAEAETEEEGTTKKSRKAAVK
jgi:hypothetical protein